MAYIKGVDVASYQLGIDFGALRAQGYETVYIKMGGDNYGPRYISGSYSVFVDQALAAGFKHIGHYWVSGRHDASVAGKYVTDRLYRFRDSDYVVLDNEKLDDGNVYSDNEAADFIGTAQLNIDGAPHRVKHYANQSFLNSHKWTQTLSTDCNFIVANYNNDPFNLHVSTVPDDRIDGHQYTSSGKAGGWKPVDLNMFKSDAFDFSNVTDVNVHPIEDKEDEDEMVTYFYRDSNSAYYELRSGGAVRQLSSFEWRALRAAYAAAGTTMPLGKVTDADYQRLIAKATK